MANFDLKTLQEFVSANPPAAALHLLRPAQPNALSEQAVQVRKEAVHVLEATLAKAGVDVQAIRQAFAGARKQISEEARTSRSRVVEPKHATNDGGRFRLLRPLAGLTVPLAPPTLSFLNAPFFFLVNETEIYLRGSNILPDDTFFRVLFEANDPLQFGRYTFIYSWSNDTDTPMLANVSTALTLLGDLYTIASGEFFIYFDKVTTDIIATGGLTLTFAGDASTAESRVVGLGGVEAETGWFDVADFVESNLPVDESIGMYIDSFIVPAHSILLIQVWTQFQFGVTFGYAGVSGNWGLAEFSRGMNRISCPGVIVIAQPVQTPPSIRL